METYYEQSVAAPRSLKKDMLCWLCRSGSVLLLLMAAMFASGLLGDDPSVLMLNWRSGIAMVICLALAGILFVCGAHLHTEYDYILRGDELEICAVLNRRRRKRLLRLNLQEVLQAGELCADAAFTFSGEGAVRRHRCYAAVCRNYIIYLQENARHVALLEMDDALCAQIRSRLPAGAWHNQEGKRTNASISG